MKNMLAYQTAGNTCAPATFANALRFLFAREEIPAELLRDIYIRGLDEWGPEGEYGLGGTSPNAVAAMSAAVNAYARAAGYPISSEFLRGEDASVLPGSRMWRELEEHPGLAAGVARIYSRNEVPHYVLLTGVSEGRIELFDPSWNSELSTEALAECCGEGAVRIVADRPYHANRSVEAGHFASRSGLPYTLIDDEHGQRIFLVRRTDPAPFDIWAPLKEKYWPEQA